MDAATQGGTEAIIAVIAAVGLLLAVDVVAFSRGKEPTFRQSALWSLGWLILGLAVAVPIGAAFGGPAAVNYTTVYLIERTLSLDNLVVFLMIFSYFAVPAAARGKLLFIGIILALAMRGLAIVVGVGLIERFHIVIYVLGALLLLLAWRMWTDDMEHSDPGNSLLVRAVRRFFPVADYSGSKMFIRGSGRRAATPLFLALVSVVAADIAFAVDSIPAAFAITTDPLLIWAANGFALLGLRALFVLVEQLIERFRYLTQTVAAVLALVAVKLLVSGVWKAPPAVSLGLVFVLFAMGMWLSVRADRNDPDSTEPGSHDSAGLAAEEPAEAADLPLGA